MNLNATKTVRIADNEDVKNIIILLRNSGMEKEKQDVNGLVNLIENMESQFNKVMNELQDVKSQLKAIEDKSIRATVARMVDTVEIKTSEVKNQFNAVKENVSKSFSDVLDTMKEKGVSAFGKTVDFLRVHSALSCLKDKLKQSVTSLNQGVSRLERIKGEIHATKSHAQNVGRMIIGKEAKQIASHNSEHGVLTGIQNLLVKTGELLSGIGKTTDSAIRKVEKLGERNEKTSVHESLIAIKKLQSGGQPSIEKISRDKTR